MIFSLEIFMSIQVAPIFLTSEIYTYIYRALGVYSAKIQGIIPSLILRMFRPTMIFDKPLTFEYTGRKIIARLTIFYYLNV